MRILLLALALSSAVPVPAERAATADDPASPYWPLKEARIKAYRDGDRRFFERLLADNFITVGPDGRRMTRADYLDAEFPVGSGRPLRPETRVEDFSAIRTGDTVVLGYREEIRTKVGERDFVETLRRLDVYVRQQRVWRLLTMTAVRIPLPPPTITMTAEQLEDYAGAYVFGPGLISIVELKDGRLFEQTSGQARGELLPVGPDLFYAPPDVEARVLFERDASGRVVAQVYRSGSQDFRAPRRD